MEKTLLAWEKPQLIVLAKSTPEESVLYSCKTQNPNQPIMSGPNDLTLQDRCAAGDTFANCSNCKARAIGGS